MYIDLVKHHPASVVHPSPLLFIHGMWHGAWCWEENFLPYFAENGYISYAMTLRGHNGSENNKSLRWTSINDYVEDIIKVVDRIKVPPVLIGHSMGGMIVQKYLEQHYAPAAVLLASPPPTGVFGATLRVAGRHPIAFLKANLTLSMYPIIETQALTKEAFFSDDFPQNKLAKYFCEMGDESYRAYLDMLLLNRPDPNRIITPMLVLGAEEDKIISTGEIEQTAQTYDTEVKIFPDLAHDMMLDTNWKSVAEYILVWLNGRHKTYTS